MSATPIFQEYLVWHHETRSQYVYGPPILQEVNTVLIIKREAFKHEEYVHYGGDLVVRTPYKPQWAFGLIDTYREHTQFGGDPDDPPRYETHHLMKLTMLDGSTIYVEEPS